MESTYLFHRPDPTKHRLTKVIGALVGGTILSAWGIGLIPFEQLPLPSYWIGIIYRTSSGLVWLAAIWYFYPQVLVRFKVKLSKKVLIGVLLVLFFTAGPVYNADFAHSSIFDAFIGILKMTEIVFPIAPMALKRTINQLELEPVGETLLVRLMGTFLNGQSISIPHCEQYFCPSIKSVLHSLQLKPAASDSPGVKFKKADLLTWAICPFPQLAHR